jgi:hypothetical protein
MAISAQDKILYVANKLGLSTLKDMQGSTGCVYDYDPTGSGVLFGNASKHLNPDQTNLNDNKFEVNSALLIETISFFAGNTFLAVENPSATNLLASGFLTANKMIVFDVIIGNKVVLKDMPIYAGGGPSTFATMGAGQNAATDTALSIVPRHQVYLEGAGILIPPQVEFSINYSVYDFTTGDKEVINPNEFIIGAYLFGTRVLLNFNTSI